MHFIDGNQIAQSIIAELKAKIFRLAIFAFLAGSLALHATPLASDTPVYKWPDTTSTIIGILPAGIEPPRFNGGYMLAIPFEGGAENWKVIGYGPSQDCWVRDTDTGFYEIVNVPDKKFYVKTGALLRVAPNAEAAVTGTMQTGDTSELRDIQGKWVKVHCTKLGMGFIQATDIFASDFPTTSMTTYVDAPPAVVFTSTLTITSTSLVGITANSLQTQSLFIYIDPSKTDFINANKAPDTPAMQQLLANITTGDTLPLGTQLCPVQPQVTPTTTSTTTTATESPKSK